MPKVQDGDDNRGNGQADSEKDAVGGEEDKQCKDGGDSDDEAGGAFDGNSEARLVRHGLYM